MLSAKPEEMGGRLLHLGAASPSRDARRMRQEDGLAESRMATAALPVTGSDAGGYRDAWSDMGGLSGRQWAGPVPGAGHCAALPVLSAGKALPCGAPAMLLMHFSFVSVFPVDSGRCPFPGGMGKVPEGGGKMPRRRNHLTGDDMTRTFLALIFLLLTRCRLPGRAASPHRDPDCRRFLCRVRPGHPHQDEVLFRPAFQEKALLRSDLFGELVFMDGHALQRGHGLCPQASAVGDP